MQRQIPKERWRSFCDEFSRVHRGWRAKLELEGPEERPQRIEEGTVFHGVVSEEEPQGTVVNLLTGDYPSHTGHLVDAPAALYLLQGEDGSDAGLRVEQDGGRALVLHFCDTVPAEALDGLGRRERQDNG